MKTTLEKRETELNDLYNGRFPKSLKYINRLLYEAFGTNEIDFNDYTSFALGVAIAYLEKELEERESAR